MFLMFYDLYLQYCNIKKEYDETANRQGIIKPLDQNWINGKARVQNDKQENKNNAFRPF